MNTSVVVVTGAGSGIGHAVVLVALARDIRVVAFDRDDAALERLRQDLAGAVGGGRLQTCVVDVADEPAMRDAMAVAHDTFGHIDAVFANAGIELNGPPHQMPIDDWHRVIATNLTGTFITCRVALATMVDGRRGGSIVCTSSPSAFVGFAGGGNAAYGASKGGVSALVRSLALDYAAHGIRVNAVVPGATKTPMLTGTHPDETTEAGLSRLAAEQIPLGRAAEPVEIAHAVLWLMSDEASYVTGSHLVVDGGLLAKGANTF